MEQRVARGGLAEREEAAAVLGASAWQRLRWVLWPTIRTPLVVGSIVVGAFALGAFEVPLTVGAAPVDAAVLAGYRDAGVKRCILWLEPGAGEPAPEEFLDRVAGVVAGL